MGLLKRVYWTVLWRVSVTLASQPDWYKTFHSPLSINLKNKLYIRTARQVGAPISGNHEPDQLILNNLILIHPNHVMENELFMTNARIEALCRVTWVRCVVAIYSTARWYYKAALCSGGAGAVWVLVISVRFVCLLWASVAVSRRRPAGRNCSIYHLWILLLRHRLQSPHRRGWIDWYRNTIKELSYLPRGHPD